MSKNRSAHLRGNRGRAFANLVRGIPPEQILCVSVNLSKYFYVPMIHNDLGEILTSPFEVDVYQREFDKLYQKIEAVRIKRPEPVREETLTNS